MTKLLKKLLNKQNWLFLAGPLLLLASWFLSKNVNNIITTTTVKKVVDKGKHCTISTASCAIQMDEGLYIAGFESPVQVEQEMYINFRFPVGSHFQQAWVEGINMYMGRTPVIAQMQQNDTSLRAVVFLGSCNLATMQWRLTASFSDKNGELVELYYDFVTEL